MEVGNIKENTFPLRAILARQQDQDKGFFQNGPVEVISAENVVFAEETFTVKCFLTMMAPESTKKVDKNMKPKIMHLTHSTCHV